MSLTTSANQFLDWMDPKVLEGLCNALAGMKPAERTRFVTAMCDRATSPMQTVRCLSVIEEWWNEKIRTGVMLSSLPEEGWLRFFPVEELVKDYIAFTQHTGMSLRGNATAMGRFLNKVMPKLNKSSINRDGKGKTRIRYYEFQSHDVAQKIWWNYIGLETARANGWPQLSRI